MSLTILFAGGGTLGPVTPLIAVLRTLRAARPDLSFAWAGTADGPERQVVEREGIPFHVVPVAKLPRYPSIQWLRLPFAYLAARREASRIIDAVKPALVVGAGGFTQVPLMHAAHARHITCLLHQLDKDPGLSNRRAAKVCAGVTTSFAYERPPFGRVPAERIPTPCRFAGAPLPSREQSLLAFGLSELTRTVLVMGGGTGAAALNRALDTMLAELVEHMQVIHVTGPRKIERRADTEGYAVRESLDEAGMLMAYAAADVVVSRAGMGSLAELAALAKPSVLVAIPDTHQERNAQALGHAVMVLPQFDLSSKLPSLLRQLMTDAKRRQALGAALHAALPTDDGTALAERILARLT